MPLGPFDRRKKQSRCGPCSSSHLKCSGSLPCNNCERKGTLCTYPSRDKVQAFIEIDKGSQKTITSYVGQTKIQPRRQTRLTNSPQADPAAYYFYYFDTFIQVNSFGRHGISSVDIKDLMQCSTRGTYLRDAVISLGAMASTKLGPANHVVHSRNRQFALTSYAHSVAGLRDALSHHTRDPQLRLHVLWTTLILGLFELMADSSGQGWVQHLVHGTSRALVSSGPATCVSGLGQRFYMEVKIFEVCRTIVFNESSFLTRPEWKALSVQLNSQTSEKEVHPLDELLDIVLGCSSLRARAANFISSLESDTPQETTGIAQEIALEGLCQRQALDAWAMENVGVLSEKLNPGATLEQDDFNLLAHIFHAATSIYLSGVFDYEMMHWNDLGILVATVGEDEIQLHVATILDLSHAVIRRSKVSPLLLLFPLRVAGARSIHDWQKHTIMTLLTKIEGTFSVATTFKQGLEYVWGRMK